jgi:hypothetical protein
VCYGLILARLWTGADSHAPFHVLAILPPRSALASASLLTVAGHLRHTSSMFVLGICTVVTPSLAMARLQLKAPATEVGLPSSLVASSSSRSSLSTAVPRWPQAPQRPQEGPEECPVPSQPLLHHRRPSVRFTAGPLIPPTLPPPLAHLSELLSLQCPGYDSSSRPLAPPLHLLHQLAVGWPDSAGRAVGRERVEDPLFWSRGPKGLVGWAVSLLVGLGSRRGSP